jgi:uncharacterized membrane protein YeaQ/YmgE (transglycosylase-associated protein family)
MSMFANLMFANLVVEPTWIAAWVCSGLAMGWLAGRVTEEPSYGSIVDLFLGAIGGLLGGLAYGFFKSDSGLGGSTVMAIIVACVFLVVGRFVLARSNE